MRRRNVVDGKGGKREENRGSGSKEPLTDVNTRRSARKLTGGEERLLMAAQQNNVAEAEDLILEVGVNVDVKNPDGMTALMVASWFGNTKMVDYLVNHTKANLDIPDQDGKTALGIAKDNGHTEIVRILERKYHDNLIFD